MVHKGNIPWNKGLKNIYSSAVLKSNSDKHKGSYEERYGKEKAKKIKDKIGIKMQQRKLTDKHKRNIGKSNKNKLKGKTFEDIHGIEYAKIRKEKMSKNNWAKKMKGNFPESTLLKKRFNTLGEKNPMWNIRGEKSHAWLGGLSYEPYPSTFNKHFKLSIKIRDNFCCMKCGLSEVNCKQLYSNQGLQIHHINYIKEDTFNENVICLCHSCNSEVNFNRELWIQFFQSLLAQRYGYEYDEDLNSEEELNNQ